MDFFGIGTAMQGMARAYFISTMRSGRTTALLHGLKPGDMVVCSSSRESERLGRLARDRQIEDVRFVTLDPKQLHDIRRFGTPQGRLIFDHGWLEEYYLHNLQHAAEQIDFAQREYGGWGESHEQTRLAAMEAARWQL